MDAGTPGTSTGPPGLGTYTPTTPGMAPVHDPTGDGAEHTVSSTDAVYGKRLPTRLASAYKPATCHVHTSMPVTRASHARHVDADATVKSSQNEDHRARDSHTHPTHTSKA
jgi:hypothetical protein